ncbi:MAG: YfhO family protein [Acidobacteriia bacterium]|nr:YfhO family protein [Terriglobia bacterium]
MNTLGTATWRHGILPLWNPYMEGGMVLGATQNPGSFYPLNVLMWLLMPAWLVLAYSIMVHLALTGVTTFLFLRSLRFHILSALLGALAFQWSGFAMSHLGHVMYLRALPWIGLALFAFNRWLETCKARFLALISISVFFLYLSGYPQVITYATLLIGTYFLFARALKPRLLLFAVAAALLGVGLSAPQVLPGLATWSSGEFLRPGQGVYSSFTSYSFHPAYTLTFLFPLARLGGFAEMVGYIGVAPFLLALLAMITVDPDEDRRIKRFFVVWAAVALPLAFGRYIAPVTKISFHIPIYGAFEGIYRHLLEFDFSFIVLAAFGMEKLRKGNWAKQLKISRVVPLAVYVCLIAILALVSPFADQTLPLQWSPASQALWKPILFIFIALLLGGIAMLNRRRFSTIALIGLLILTVYDLADFGIPIYSGGFTSPNFYTKDPAAAELIHQRIAPTNPYRILSFEAPGAMDDRELGKELLAANYFVTYQLESLIGHEGLQLRRFNAAFEGKIPPWGNVEIQSIKNLPFRKMINDFGVKYILARNAGAPQLSTYYNVVGTFGPITLFENPMAKPRLFIDEPEPTTPTPTIEDAIQIRKYRGDRIEADVNFKQTRTLVHGTSYVKGWKARVDGKETPVFLVDEVLQGIRVPAGNHRIEFYYDPKSFKQGLAISIVSLGLLLGMCLRIRLRNKSNPFKAEGANI